MVIDFFRWYKVVGKVYFNECVCDVDVYKNVFWVIGNI